MGRRQQQHRPGIQALVAMNIDPATVAKNKTGPEYLRNLQLDCGTESVNDRGALDYQKFPEVPLAPNDFATAQATAALAGSTLPVQPQEYRLSSPRSPVTTRQNRPLRRPPLAT